MTLLLVYLAVAALAGAVALARPVCPPRAWPLLALAALPQLLTIAGARHSALALLSLGLGLAWCWRNRGLPGGALLGLGLSLNLLVMSAHGGAMPVRAEQLAELGLAAPPGAILAGSKDTAVSASPLWWLADWLPLSTPLVSLILSPGDLIVAAGLARWLAAGRPPRTEAHHDDLVHTAPAGALPAGPRQG